MAGRDLAHFVLQDHLLRKGLQPLHKLLAGTVSPVSSSTESTAHAGTMSHAEKLAAGASQMEILHHGAWVVSMSRKKTRFQADGCSDLRVPYTAGARTLVQKHTWDGFGTRVLQWAVLGHVRTLACY